jgi:hypothetical protein
VSGRKPKPAAGPEAARDPSSLDAQLFPDEKPAEDKPAGTGV